MVKMQRNIPTTGTSPADIPTIAGTSYGILKVIVKNQNGAALSGIPVWCYQIKSKWQHNTVKTNSSGVAKFDQLIAGSMASYGVNYGSFFGCEEVKEQRVGIYSNKTSIKEHKIKCSGAPPGDGGGGEEPPPGGGG